MEKNKILIVDDHRVVCEALKKLITNSLPELENVETAYSGEEALAKIENFLPHLVLLDIAMPGQDGLEVLKILKSKYPEIKVIMLSMHEEEEKIFQAIKNGAVGYVLKSSSPERLCSNIKSVLEGYPLLDPYIAQLIINKLQAIEKKYMEKDVLSEREKEVLKLLTKGLTNREIAEALGLTEKTIKAHLRSIFKKLKVRTRTKAIAYAIKEKLI